MAMPNIYHLRRVAPDVAKPCFICFKPTPSVLITPDNKDFFYTCDGHLKDKGFASPIVDKEEEEAKRKKEEMTKAIEEVKKEYEEKQKAKKKKKEEKKKDKDGDKKEDKKEDKVDSDKDEEDRDEKIKAIESGTGNTAAKSHEPRIFALHKSVYQMRISRLQNAQQARRTAEKLRNPSAFPSVPTGNP